MRRREAQSQCPELRIEPRRPEQEVRVFERVVAAVATIVPRVECTEPGTITFLARGPSRVCGGDESMASQVAQRAAAEIAAAPVGVGVGDGRFTALLAARVAARSGQPVVVPIGKAATAAFLAPFPVRALTDIDDVDGAMVHLLHRLGVRTLGDVAALDAVDLVERFGPVGGFAHRVAAAGDDRLPGATDPPPDRVVQHAFDEPVHHAHTVVFVARGLAEQLIECLAGTVCTRLAVLAETDHGERSERSWYRAAGLGVGAIVERVRWQLDAWVRDDALTAGVVRVVLDPLEVRPDHGTPTTLWGGATDDERRAVRAIARLGAIAGEERVLVPAAAGGRQPHDRHRWVPAATVDPADAPDRMAAPVPWRGALPDPAPAVVHEVPLPVEVLDATGDRVSVSGRGAPSAPPTTVVQAGRRHPVAAWSGPWPLDERWWDVRRARRLARLQVLTDDGRLLLVCLEGGVWSLWGEYR